MWKAGYDSNARVMSFATMQAIRRLASLGNSDADKPDLYITTEALKDAYEATLQVQVRYSDKSLARLRLRQRALRARSPRMSARRRTTWTGTTPSTWTSFTTPSATSPSPSGRPRFAPRKPTPATRVGWAQVQKKLASGNKPLRLPSFLF